MTTIQKKRLVQSKRRESLQSCCKAVLSSAFEVFLFAHKIKQRHGMILSNSPYDDQGVDLISSDNFE